MNQQRKYNILSLGSAPTTLSLFKGLPEITGYEVVFNKMTMSPSPTPLHQLLLSDLHALIYAFLKENNAGKLLTSPTDVYLEHYESAIQPDLLIILNDNLHQIKKDSIYGAPDVVIEILSRNRAYDTQRKKSLYEMAGVTEYFMIDPENKKTIFLTLNEAGVYEQTYEEVGVFNSNLLSCKISF